jgi:hypothetical protein
MRNRQFFATFTVGALFGAAVLLTMRGHDLDLLYLRLTQERTKYAQLQEDHEKLKERLTHIEKENVRKIRKINVEVVVSPDEFTKLSIQKEIKNRMKKLVDKDIAIFEDHPDIFSEFLENRNFTVSDHTITVKVKQVVLSETTTIFIEAFKMDDTLKSTAKGT